MTIILTKHCGKNQWHFDHDFKHNLSTKELLIMLKNLKIAKLAQRASFKIEMPDCNSISKETKKTIQNKTFSIQELEEFLKVWQECKGYIKTNTKTTFEKRW